MIIMFDIIDVRSIPSSDFIGMNMKYKFTLFKRYRGNYYNDFYYKLNGVIRPCYLKRHTKFEYIYLSGLSNNIDFTV